MSSSVRPPPSASDSGSNIFGGDVDANISPIVSHDSPQVSASLDDEVMITEVVATQDQGMTQQQYLEEKSRERSGLVGGRWIPMNLLTDFCDPKGYSMTKVAKFMNLMGATQRANFDQALLERRFKVNWRVCSENNLIDLHRTPPKNTPVPTSSGMNPSAKRRRLSRPPIDIVNRRLDMSDVDTMSHQVSQPLPVRQTMTRRRLPVDDDDEDSEFQPTESAGGNSDDSDVTDSDEVREILRQIRLKKRRKAKGKTKKANPKAKNKRNTPSKVLKRKMSGTRTKLSSSMKSGVCCLL